MAARRGEGARTTAICSAHGVFRKTEMLAVPGCVPGRRHAAGRQYRHRRGSVPHDPRASRSRLVVSAGKLEVIRLEVGVSDSAFPAAACERWLHNRRSCVCLRSDSLPARRPVADNDLCTTEFAHITYRRDLYRDFPEDSGLGFSRTGSRSSSHDCGPDETNMAGMLPDYAHMPGQRQLDYAWPPMNRSSVARGHDQSRPHQ